MGLPAYCQYIDAFFSDLITNGDTLDNSKAKEIEDVPIPILRKR
jgi:hypothetical protein